MGTVKHVDPGLELSGKTALVGSSNCLLSTKYGNEIDSYDDVVRFNRSPTEGYGDHVGEKCTLRVVNIHVYGNVDAHRDGYSSQPQYFVKNLRNSNVLCISGDGEGYIRHIEKGNIHESTNLFIFNWDQLNQLKSQYGYNSEKAPTIGLITIFLCIASGITPDLYGFHDDGSWGHYWENRPPAGPCHDIGQDKEVISRLNKQGLVRIYLK